VPEPDLDQILYDRLPVVLALDQRPFEHSKGAAVNTFSVFVPLLPVAGGPFTDPETAFANRGRVWWMLRPEDKREITEPGAIWTACIERTPQFEPSHPDKDRYQVVRPSATYGARDFVDLLDVPFDAADMGAALAKDGVAVERPPLRLVLLRSTDSISGPFHAAWDGVRSRVTLSAPNPGKPEVLVAPRATFRRGEHFFEFSFRANRWCRDEKVVDITIRLVHAKHLETLKKAGRTVDAASDDQVIKSALTLASYTGAERSAFRDALSRLPATGAEGESAGRMARFRALCENAERVRSLGVEAAEAVGKQPAFRGLVTAHADALVESRVQDLLRQRTADVEKAAAETTARLEKAKADLAQLEGEYDQRKSKQEAELEAEKADWIRALEQREAAVTEREGGLARRQKEMEQRLRGIVERYENRGREIGDEILAQVPILSRLGLGGGPRPTGEDVPQKLTLPAWLEEPRVQGGLTEAAFLAQFRDVAERRGYVFDETDLVNFHVAVKTGFWTVLAGPSGTGKTSLPRLYAEALGCLDEYLTVPVRPDWLDDRDVIGAFNALAGRFEPAPTGLVDRLVAAAEDAARTRGGLYVVCLDEMNLARVEHYFAQFLSVAEEPPARRRLRLFSRGVERPGEPYALHRELLIGSNVRFVGTVNVDETTHFFSPKVLDRTPVLVFEPPSIDRESSAKAKAAALSTTPVHAAEYAAWIRGPEDADPAVRAFLVAIDKPLRGIRSGIGFRVRDRVLAYTASAKDLLPPDRALDLALAQGIVPRMRAQEPGFSDAAEALSDLLPEQRFPRSSRLLTRLREAGGNYDFFQLL
jgi:hypothetical protein